MHSRWGRDAYLKSYWNWLDGIVVMVSIINMVPLRGGRGITSFVMILLRSSWLQDILYGKLMELTTWMYGTEWILWLNAKHETNVGHWYNYVGPYSQRLFTTYSPKHSFPDSFWGPYSGSLILEGGDYSLHLLASKHQLFVGYPAIFFPHVYPQQSLWYLATS